jgi:cytochrome c-type biogenesis protein CcmF
MIHETIGSVGHLFVIISFVTALLATFAYFKSTQSTNELENDWKMTARVLFGLHFIAVIVVAASLFVIIYNHYFEYHYAFTHSSLQLPAMFMISCYWEGQEGSFLLWIFWQAILGLLLMIKNPKWESPVMTVFALVQTFLTSMILGVIIPWIDLKIGSSPFLLLREAQPDLPVWSMQPNFIPKDGRGLNPLLQNYWMVIHPPTLFLGFALTLVPFAYLIAGLWKKKLTEWVLPALPWALFGAGVLGIGIMMGAYWAYETLNFGGYWNWDPVENASFVPWLVLLGAIHTMIAHKTSSSALKTSIILVIAAFILVLYSTFLNRSGILGNASVHSFTDLGLSGQLLLYMGTFLLGAIGLSIYRWKDLPKDIKELGTYNREFWVFVGAAVLGLSAFQLLFTTSIPVYNKIAEAFGILSNIALPADQAEHYSKIQIWIFLAVAILSAIGQYVWWGKIKKSTSFKPLLSPALVATLLSVVFINIGKIYTLPYIALLWSSLFAVLANFKIMWFLIRERFSLAGGAMAHVGLAIMLIGILFSAGYSKVVSLNRSGFAISTKVEDFTKNDNKENKENLPLWLGQGAQMQDYLVTYKGRRIEVRGQKGFFNKNDFEIIEGDFHAVALKNIERNGLKIANKGDTVTVEPENTYYELEFKNEEGKAVSLFPRWQVNPKMGTAISPDVKHAWNHDIYTYVSLDPRLAAEAGSEKQWSQTENQTVTKGDTLFINDFVAILKDVTRVTAVDGVELAANDAAVQANFQVLGKNSQQFTLSPIFIIKGGMVAMPAFESEETGIKIKFTGINPQAQEFGFAWNTTQQELIVVKALEKPYINLVWIGSILIFIGLFIASYRRMKPAIAD